MAAPRATTEQMAASDPGASSWVSASAGTGKTHVLTDRVLRLLLTGASPERLLCLTFTKAAAAEMFNRLHERLGDWAISDDEALHDAIASLTGQVPDEAVLTRARRLFAQVLETPGGLKIQTIHAFCEALLRRFPIEAGIAPHFEVLDERDAAELMQQAMDRVLTEDTARKAPLIGAITAYIDQARFNELMRALISEQGQLKRFLDGRGGRDGAVERMRTALGLSPGESEETVLAHACADMAFDHVGLRQTAGAMQDGGKTDQQRGSVIQRWLAEPATRAEMFDTYLSAFFTGNGQGDAYKRAVTKKVADAMTAAEDILATEIERLAAVRLKRRAAQTAAATTALIDLAAALMQGYEQEKAQYAQLDYDDLILTTRDLLTGSGAAQWVLYKLDGGLEHILVDEAQDTNPDQWQVVQALAEEFFAGAGAREQNRTVFAVGDVKQSIYGFQRADPAAFEAMRKFFGERVMAADQHWRPVALSRSYRSVPAVLQAVDAIFAVPPTRAGLTFDDSEIRHIAHRQGEAGVVEIWPTEAPAEDSKGEPEAWTPPVEQQPEDDPVQRLAERIADTIADWQRNEETLPARGRPIRPGDVLILVQKRAPFVETMVRELKRRAIPVAGVDRMVLTEQLAVMDLVALGQFLLLPDDDLTLATVLKSPLFGFDDDLLFKLAWDRPGRLWRALQARQDENTAFKAAHDRLARLLARTDLARPFELYAELLGPGGGRRRMLARLGPDANDPIDEFMALALQYERDHAPSLQGFLHWLAAAETEVKRDQETRRDEVRVMTVHGAKGLQAPVVFLADTCRIPQEDTTLHWLRDGDGGPMPVWCPLRDMAETVVSEARAAAVRRRDEEYRRLFYVALTRAADRLYITGFEGKRKRPADCWYDMAWQGLSALAEAQEVDVYPGGAGLRLTTPQTAEPPPATGRVRPAAVSGLPDWLDRPAPPEPTPPQPLAPSRPSEDEPAAISPIGDGGAARFRRGNLVHALLQTLPELPEDAREAATERYLAGKAHDLADAAPAELKAEVLAVLATPDFAPLFGPGSQAEVAVAGLLGTQTVAGQIDRLVVTDEHVMIIDYKTNRPPPLTAAETPLIYLRQMATYRALLRQIYPDKAVLCALLWTDGPRLMALDSDILDRYTP